MKRNPYEFHEKPCLMITTFVKSFEEQQPIICHKDKTSTIKKLLEHGYCERIKPNKKAMALFKRLKCGDDLPESFKYSPLPDNDINNYEFFELTLAGTTAVYYHYQQKALERLYKNRIKILEKQIYEELLETISKKFKEL